LLRDTLLELSFVEARLCREPLRFQQFGALSRRP